MFDLLATVQRRWFRRLDACGLLVIVNTAKSGLGFNVVRTEERRERMVGKVTWHHGHKFTVSDPQQRNC